VTNSNRGSISHHFRDTATYSLKLSIKNHGQTAADGDMATLLKFCRPKFCTYGYLCKQFFPTT